MFHLLRYVLFLYIYSYADEHFCICFFLFCGFYYVNILSLLRLFVMFVSNFSFFSHNKVSIIEWFVYSNSLEDTYPTKYVFRMVNKNTKTYKNINKISKPSYEVSCNFMHHFRNKNDNINLLIKLKKTNSE